MDGMTGERKLGSARCELRVCTALPKRMHSRTREIVALEVPAADRRRGLGRELLEQVTDEADECGMTLVIMPAPFGSGDAMGTNQLAQWYQRRFGFAAIQAAPIIMARIPGSTPRFVTPIAAATRTAIDQAANPERRK